jgi:NTP pyrophosphatase (non-canonical NTP hydrolase)
MTYYLYHIPGKKIGVTCNLKHRVEEQQGYHFSEYEVLLQTDDIDFVSNMEIALQKKYGYRIDAQLYKNLYKNNFKQLNNMNINITEQTTTFPCPVNKLKGQLMDNMGMTWETDHGTFAINKYSIDWIMKNVQISRYNVERSYVYNKAFARFHDNHQTHDYPSNGHETRTGGLAPTGMKERKCKEYQDHDPEDYDMPQCCDKGECLNPTQFDLIRTWAEERGLYEKGDPKTQSLKLVEEVGEICRATLKEDHDEVIDGIGDCVVVLTNLAELHGVSIEECIASAYGVISKRTGKMVNGTFKKD